MSETFNIAKVAAALKRAAHKALHGTREERSGRFLLQEKTEKSSSARRHERAKRTERNKRHA
jgi:hypothetical protein